MKNATTTARISISYRDEGHGKGALYDHYSIQNQTKSETSITVSSSFPHNTKKLRDYIKTHVHELPYGTVDMSIGGKKVPVVENDLKKTGLLIITGVTGDNFRNPTAEHKKRIEHEKSIIKTALQMGKPIFAICAGSWTVGSVLGMELVDVEDHAYRKMPYIVNSGKIGNNKQVHDIEVSQGTLAHCAMGLSYTNQSEIKGSPEWMKSTATSQRLTTNSLHWKALSVSTDEAIQNEEQGLREMIDLKKHEENIEDDDTSLRLSQERLVALARQKNMRCSGLSKQNPTIKILNCQRNELKPTVDSAEIVESIFGAPVILHQGHPEAYNWSSRKLVDVANRNLLMYMAKAGDAFLSKQNMHMELLKRPKIN